jgi:DNA-binding SARP family transcriptional activator/Tfp pilus assembly protein PilF
VEFGLLGPLVVRVGGSRVPVSAGKQRVLLAALLLRANQVVSAAELAEAVWEGSPPGSARVTLQNYVKRLRQALGPVGYERIVTRPAGYLIEVGAGELDLSRFGELQAAGHVAARTGAWDTSSAQLGAALALWRGQPLSDVPSRRLVQSEVPRLAEMRLEALEARIDADLHLGRHREVIAELQALAAAEPLRERLHELLMLALYRSGQQAAALACYLRARRQLVEQIGIEPGPGLRDLNQRILCSDPALLLAPAPVSGDPATANGGPAAKVDATANGGPAVDHQSATEGHPETVNGGPFIQNGPAAVHGSVPAPRPGSAEDSMPFRPNMLPAGVAGFTGRVRELEVLSALVRRAGGAAGPGAGDADTGGPAGVGPVVVAIGGTAGVGKTALAVQWARSVAGQFPDGQLYVNLRGFGPLEPLAPGEVLRGFLDALQVPSGQVPGSVEGRQALFRGLVAGKRLLVVLDNARDAGQVRPLLAGSAGAVVVVTSRAELAGLVVAEGAVQLGLDVLSVGEARLLLAGRLGAGRVAAEPGAADELIGLCARLPLALAITAARAVAHPGFSLAALAGELGDVRGRLDALSTGEDSTDVRAVLSWSYRKLAGGAARLLRLLGLHPGPDITVAAAASLAGCDAGVVRGLLRELTRWHLLAEPVPGRYAFHDLLRAYAAGQAAAEDSDADRHAAIHRMLDHYLHTGYAAALLLNPSRDPITLVPPEPGVTPEQLASHQQALAWFEAEHQVLLGTVALAAEAGFDAYAWQLPWAIATFLDGQARWHELASIQHTAVAAAVRLGDDTGQIVASRSLATACASLGDYDQARTHLAGCIGLCRKLGDRPREARVHLIMGFVDERQARHQDALHHTEQALALFQAVGDQDGQTAALNAIGWCCAQLGDYERARACCQEALAMYREGGNRYGEAYTWDSLGFAEHHLGLHAEAITSYGRAIELQAELGNRLPQANSLTHLGDTHLAAGDPGAARDAWERALAILDGLGHVNAEEVRTKLRQIDSTSQAELASPGPA